jgi:hypothetical protein
MAISKPQTHSFLAAGKGNACYQVVLITWYDCFETATLLKYLLQNGMSWCNKRLPFVEPAQVGSLVTPSLVPITCCDRFEATTSDFFAAERNVLLQRE